MKIYVQPQCSIINRSYKVKFSDKILKASDCLGQVDHTDEVIRLNRRRSDPQKLDVLIHEALEVIHDCLGFNLDHDVAIALAPCLAQFLVSVLDIEPDFSLIDEERVDVEQS